MSVAVSVGAAVDVRVGVAVLVAPGGAVGLRVGVRVGALVAVIVGVSVRVGVAVRPGVIVGVIVAVDVGVRVGVAVRVTVGVCVPVEVRVTVGVGLGDRVGVPVSAVVGVRVGVGVGMLVGVEVSAKTVMLPLAPLTATGFAPGSDAPARFCSTLTPDVAPTSMWKLQENSGPSGMMLALSSPNSARRKIFASGGDVGRPATSVFPTGLFTSMSVLMVQSGLPFAFNATFTCVES